MGALLRRLNALLRRRRLDRDLDDELAFHFLPTFIAVPLLCGLVAALASYGPVRRATRVDPIVALRVD